MSLLLILLTWNGQLYNMKTLFTITLIGTAMYFLLPYIIVASILMFDGFLFGHIIDTALAPSPQQ